MTISGGQTDLEGLVPAARAGTEAVPAAVCPEMLLAPPITHTTARSPR